MFGTRRRRLLNVDARRRRRRSCCACRRRLRRVFGVWSKYFALRKVGKVFSRRCTRESCSAMVGCRRVHVDEGERGWAGAVDVVDAAGASILGWSVASLLVICCNGPDNIVTGYAK